jgi:glycerol-3-phosphate O-acyltransferase
MDIMGNFVDAEGTSFDSRNNPLNINDYFITEGVITEDLQREAEYTKLLAERIVDRFHRENIVLSSHVVAFTAFNMLKANNESFDLYALLRLPVDDFVFPIENFTAAIEAVQSALFELEEKGRLKLSDAIRLSAAELVEDGMKNLGVYHARKPLLFNKKGDIESDDFSTLFYYHNRLENFGLTKRVRWDKYKLEMQLGEFVKVEN